MEVKQAVIMVGGKGTRLYPLTENTPKPALPVLDMPCLKYLIRSFASAGITDVFLACGYKSDVLQKAIGDGSDLGVNIIYSDEDTPLGTGGAMKQLEDRLDPVFAAANGDTFIDIDLREQIALHLSTGAKITIALTTVENPCEYGIARIMDDGRITEFKDKPKPEASPSSRTSPSPRRSSPTTSTQASTWWTGACWHMSPKRPSSTSPRTWSPSSPAWARGSRDTSSAEACGRMWDAPPTSSPPTC